jgi:hypothetical protein
VLVNGRGRRRSIKRKRSLHVHSLLRDRLEKGLFYTLYDDLRQGDRKFFQYFRMSKTSFDELLENVKEEITEMGRILRRAVPTEEKRALT